MMPVNKLSALKIIVGCWAALAGGADFLAAAVPVAVHQQTLAEHLAQQLSSRTNGCSCDFTRTVSGPCFISSPVITTNFWLRDVTNIFAGSVGMIQGGCLYSDASFVTPISPRFVLGAAHCGGQGTADSVWLLPGGVFYTNAGFVTNGHLARVNIRGTDLMITLMAKTNPCFCKYLPSITNKISFLRTGKPAGQPAPVFVRFHLTGRMGLSVHTSFISAGNGQGWFGGIQKLDGVPRFGDYTWGDSWVGGDSGSPAFAIIRNEAVLICCAYWGGGGPAISSYVPQINAAMAELAAANGVPVETVTAYDLSPFPDQ